MPISKIIYKASDQATGEIWMDSTPATAAAADILAPKTALLANGVLTTGTGTGGGGDTYTRTVIAPQQIVTPDSSRQAVLAHTGVFVDGEYYIVTLDGTEWLTSCETLWSNNYVVGEAQLFLGNNFDMVFPFAGATYQGSVEFVFQDTNQHTVKVEHLEFVDGPLNLIEKSITANGTYNASSDNADGYSSVTVNVSGGGGVEEKDVNFIDFDGSIVASYTAADFASLSALPANPSHSGLTAKGWNWSLSDAKTYVASYGKLWIGQMYVTDDGKTRIYIHLDNPDFLSPYLAIAVNGTVVVDWGDNSSTDTMTGTSNTTLKYQGHVYAATGDYTITLNPTSGKFTFYCSSQTYVNVLRSVGAQDNRATSRAYSGSITKIHIGNNADIGKDAFNYLVNCKAITIPNTVTSFGSYAFYNCNSLKSITIPNNMSSLSTYCFQYCNSLDRVSISRSVTEIGNYAFNYCRSLKTITIPNSTTTIGNSAFRACDIFDKITIPSSVTSIGTYVFYYDYALTAVKLSSGITSISDGLLQSCYSLKTIEIPSGVTSIGAYAFNGCNDALEYHLLPTTPPTLSNTNAFTGIQSGTIIYVPYSADHSVLNNYKTASNWSTYASYMQEEPA